MKALAVTIIILTSISAAYAFDFDAWESDTLAKSKKNIDSSIQYKVQPRNAEYEFRGKRYKGMLWNNKIVPAISVSGRQHPACIHEHQLYKAAILNKKLVCELEIIKQDKFNILLIEKRKKQQDTGNGDGGSAKKNGSGANNNDGSSAAGSNKKNSDGSGANKNNDGSSAEGSNKNNNGDGSDTNNNDGGSSAEEGSKKMEIERTLGTGSTNLGTTESTIKIKKGTYIKARLVAPVASSNQSYTEFETIETVYGINGNISSGASLFCSNHLNPAAESIEFLCNSIVDADSQEYNVSATVHRTDKQAGLAGKMDYKVGSIVEKNVSNSLFSGLVGSAANISDLAGNIAQDSTNAIKGNDAAKLPVMTVYPQEVLIRFN
jgi:hypothetical protein